MNKLTPKSLFLLLNNNEDNMIIYARLPDAAREGIRDMWDELITQKNFVKYGFEGWRECRDQGPQKHVVYALRKFSSNEAILKPKKDVKEPKTLVINDMDVCFKLKDMEERLALLEIAVAGLCNRRIPNFDSVSSIIRDGIEINN